jgi:hypothetical protein
MRFFLMSDRDSGPDSGEDDSDTAARISFRDYPSTAVVVIAALSSGLAWLMFRWRAKKGTAHDTAAINGSEGKHAAKPVKPSSSKRD